MAKRPEPKSDKIKILEVSQVQEIDWLHEELYDFSTTPQEVRQQVIAHFLDWHYEHYRHEMSTKYRKVISQTDYANKTVGFDDQLFSLYKRGNRFPIQPNADILAMYYGPIIWDICGYNRRMPKDKKLHEIADLWPKLSDKGKAELLERMRNMLDNGDNTQDPEVQPRDVYF